jgi:nucleoside-diphosphate-sugar epimerase
LYRNHDLRVLKLKTLVTGASGFVGKKLLKMNSDFLGVDIDPHHSGILRCDIRNSSELIEIISKNNIDSIIHLAGKQYTKYVKPKARESFFLSNVQMALAIKDATTKAKLKRIIYVSTDMVYGSNVESPVIESTPTNPIGPYGESKLKAEEILQSINKDVAVSILRPRLIIGAGRAGTIDKLAKLIHLKLPVVLIGSGRNRYQFISVDDVCVALQMLLEKGSSGVFNIGSDNPPTVDKLFKETLGRLDVGNPIVKVPSALAFFVLEKLDTLGIGPLAPEQFRLANIDYVLDTSRLKRELQWKPQFQDNQLLFEALYALLQMGK